MASYPREEHSYILDSFEEFEALARRALHEGGVFNVENNKKKFFYAILSFMYFR